MKKLPGVEDVHVSLEKASTDILLRPGNTITLAQLRQVIKNGGFKAGEAGITAIGRLVDEKGRLALDLAPAKASLLLDAGPGNAAALAEARELRTVSTATVEVTGTVAKADTLVLKSVTRR